MKEIKKFPLALKDFLTGKRGISAVLLAAVLLISLIVSTLGMPEEDVSIPAKPSNSGDSAVFLPENLPSPSDIPSAVDHPTSFEQLPESTLTIPSRAVGSGTDNDGFVEGWY